MAGATPHAVRLARPWPALSARTNGQSPTTPQLTTAPLSCSPTSVLLSCCPLCPWPIRRAAAAVAAALHYTAPRHARRVCDSTPSPLLTCRPDWVPQLTASRSIHSQAKPSYVVLRRGTIPDTPKHPATAPLLRPLPLVGRLLRNCFLSK